MFGLYGRKGVIQPDPVDKPEIVVAAMTCVIHCAADTANDGFNGIDEAAGGAVSWTRDRINFPHEDIVRNLASTLGDTLSGEPGISSTYFGQGASRPVLRA